MLHGQGHISAQTPMPTDRVDDTSVVNSSSAETVVWYFDSSNAWGAAVGEAAGTVCYAKLTYSGVTNSLGSSVGSYNDTSLSFAAATRAETLVSVPEAVFTQMETLGVTDKIAMIGNYLTTSGYFAVDHRRGAVWCKHKATVANDSATYKYQTPLSGGGTGDKIDLIKVGGTSVTAAGSTLIIPTTLTGGSKTVTTSGTALALGTTLATKSIYIRAKSANTGNIFVGDSAVDAVTSQQIILTANDSMTLDIADRATVFVDCSVNGEGVDYVCMS